MEENIRKLKESEDGQNKKKRTVRRLFFFFAVVLLFSGIAVLSLLLERPKGQWTLVDSDGAMKSDGSAISNGSNHFSAGSAAFLSSESSLTANKIPVYIVGEVVNPGVYEIKPGSFLYQLVELAGGLTPNAAEDSVNLAYQISVNQMIRIPSKKEIENGEGGGTGESLILDHQNGFSNGTDGAKSGNVKVNINAAEEGELDTLPGIGAATAAAIIAYRNENGKFATIEDLMKVPGIKENKFNQIKSLIDVK